MLSAIQRKDWMQRYSRQRRGHRSINFISRKIFTELSQILFLLSLCFVSVIIAVDVQIRYSLPMFAMELIIIDDNVSLQEFQSELDSVVRIHLLNVLRDELPNQDEILNRNRLVNVTLESVIDRSPIDLDENSDSVVKLSSIRSGFKGTGTFSYTESFVQTQGLDGNVEQNYTQLTPYLLDAFRQRKGFWDFAEMIIDNDVLSITGKLQIAVNDVLVGEADLLNDQPDDQGMSGIVTGIISISCVFFVCIGGIGGIVCYRRHQEKELERKSKERRELSHKLRSKSLGSSSLGQSLSSREDSSWMDSKNKEFSPVPDRLEGKSMYSGKPYLHALGTTYRPDNETNKNVKSDFLLDMIEEEMANDNDHVPSRYPDGGLSCSMENDGEDSDYFSVQSSISSQNGNGSNIASVPVNNEELSQHNSKVCSKDVSKGLVHDTSSNKDRKVIPVLKSSLKRSSGSLNTSIRSEPSIDNGIRYKGSDGDSKRSLMSSGTPIPLNASPTGRPNFDTTTKREKRVASSRMIENKYEPRIQARNGPIEKWEKNNSSTRSIV
jgi:hypothetical protein